MKDYFSWEYYGMDKIRELAQADGDYQTLLGEFEEILPRYMAVYDSLTPEQQEALLDFECCQGNLRHMETMIGYDLGRRTPRFLGISPECEKNSCNK